jgi:predicted GIY-YIG superfamily endonuclease
VTHDAAPADATPTRPRRRSSPRLTNAERVERAVVLALTEGVPARQAALQFEANARTVQRRVKEAQAVNGNVPDFATTRH